MNKVKILLMAGIISVGAIGSSVVYAASTSSYSTTVGRVNGDGYTGSLTKSISNQAAKCYSKIGGGYGMDVRVQRTNGSQSGNWVRINSGHTVELPNKIGANLSTRLHFSNDIGTLVNVQVSGRWNPDKSNFK